MHVKNTRIQLALALLLIGVAAFIGAAVSFYSQNELEKNIHEQLMTQRETMYSLAVITDSNGTDDVVSEFIQDCPQRARYDSLLTNLGTLSQKDLLDLQSLSENCSKFYPGRKAAMVSRLERELESYSDLVDLMKLLNTDKIDLYELSKWSELVQLEVIRSSLLNEQDDIQTQIITLLIQGNSVNSVKITDSVKDAQNINELLTKNDVRIDEIRTLIIH